MVTDAGTRLQKLAEPTEKDLLEGRAFVDVSARFVGERIDTRALELPGRLADFPLIVRAGRGGYVALFRFGVVVMFGLESVEQASFLKDLERFVIGPFDRPEVENAVIRVGAEEQERAENGVILLRAGTLARLQAVAEVLAKSVVLAYHESRIAGIFDNVEPLAQRLQSGRSGGVHGKQLLKHIGDVLRIQTNMAGRVEVLEKPEFLWDLPDVERLYVRLSDEYQLTERNRALEHKLDLISHTARTLLEMSVDTRSLRVEWYIVTLIVVEILLTLYEMFLRP